MPRKVKYGVCSVCAAQEPPDTTEKPIRARSMCAAHYERWRRVTKKNRVTVPKRVTPKPRVTREPDKRELASRGPTPEGFMLDLPTGFMTAIKGIVVDNRNTRQ